MANIKISDLTSAASVSGTQQFEVNESGTSKKVTGAQIAAYVEGEVSSSPTFTGQVSNAAGSAASPSISVTGDSNTGIYFPAADTVGISTGGSERLRLDASGNVGIGRTPAVGYKLQTSGTIGANDGTVEVFMAPVAGSNASIIGNVSNHDLVLYTNNAESMRIKANGNVGIGTTPASYRLHVLQTGGSAISANFRTDQTESYISFRDTVNSSDSSVRIGSAGNNLIGITAGSERFRVDASGNVAIGTTSTSDKFHIRQAGSVYAKIQCDNVGAGAGWYFTNTTTNWLIGSGPVSGGGEFAFYDMTRSAERMRIDTSGNVLVTSSGGLGYGTGSGGGVTQLTSKTTAVTVNKTNGYILTSNSALGGGASATFTVSNSTFAVSDNVVLNSTNGNYSARVANNNNGSFTITLKNETGGSLSDAVQIQFAIIKAVFA